MSPSIPRIGPRAWLSLLLLAALSPTAAPAQNADDPDADREAKAVARFATLLEKTPRRGTSLDRVYGFHVERGTLDSFVDSLREKADGKKGDGSAWMLVGLVESQRGRDSSAVEAFRKAEAARPDDPLASFYLGQSLVLVGQTDQAVEAFERALKRKPARADAMEIYQALGRVHQRARRTDQALKVWERLEAQFPDDARVAEQIAVTLAEEGQPAMALPRYEKLASKARDPYRKVQFALEAADLKVRLGKKDEALGDFEGILATLNPDSWLHKEVRRKIDEVFLRNDDQAGLATYYEGWLKKHADDIDAITRRAKVLSNLGRAAEAREDLAKAVKLAPSRRDLRIALVDQYVAEKNFAEAAKQYEELAKTDPNNPDNLREWGRLLLRDPAVPEADRKQAAARVWNKLLETRPKDAAVAAQVADLYRKAEMTDEALALYRKAVDLAAGAPQYREYLGEYLHSLKKGDEALAVWKAMAEGPNRNATNLGRLAEVLSGFGYKADAEKAAAEAVTLDPKGFEWRLKHADLLAQLDRHADALRELAEAEKLADDAEQAETVLTAEIKSLQAGNTLNDRIGQLQKELEAGQDANADRYRRLARYDEAAQKLPEATAAINKALEIDPKSVPSYTVAARLAETSGNLGRAAEVFRKLAEIDRRARTEHFTAVARLEARLGRRDEALKAGRELLAAAPNNPEHYQTFAELCFGLGENEEALKALRRASQLNDSDPRAALTLAEALSNQFRTDEAIEVYWRAFEKSTELDPKVGVIAKLVPLYLQQNQFERLTARIERVFQERDAAQQQSREKAACLAQAYAGAGDLPAARQQLESLLAVNPRDTQLLGQLEGLAESEGDFGTAARYQKQILDAAPGFENASKLAQLYLKSGEFTEAENLWAGMAGEEAESHRVLQAIDNLLVAGKFELVESVTAKLIGRDPSNWDALYREGYALASQDKYAEAVRRFEAILALNLEDDQLAAVERAKQKASGGRPSGATLSSASMLDSVYQQNKLYRRQSTSYEIQRLTGLNPQYGIVQGRVWTPTDFGQARMAALAWALVIAQRDDQQDAFLKKYGDAAPTSPRSARDWYYLNAVRADGSALYKAALNLARTTPADPEAQFSLLVSAGSRTQAGNSNVVRAAAAGPAGQVDRTPPLPDDEMKTLLAAFNTIRAREPNWLGSAASTNMVTELKRAKRTDEVNAIDRELTDAANTVQSISSALSRAADRADVPQLLALSDRMDRVATGRAAATVGNAPSAAVNKAMVILFDRGERDQALKLLDHFLDILSRPDRVAQRTRGQGQSAAATQLNRGQNIMIQTGPNQTQYVNLDLPLVGSYYDLGTISILRNAFEMHRRGDVTSDFLAHLADRKAKAQDDPIYSTLALAYARWWNGDRDEAMQALTAASELAPNDADLKLGVAEILAGRNEPAEALALADSVEPTDQKLMQRRELLAMRLAVLTGDVDRARRAAERLFGLRLDPNTQVHLAEQMHQLGQHELAEAVLGRARRRASNDVNALVALMLQYQRQNQADQAIQVAYQILRRSPRQNANSPYIAVNSVDGAQQQALQVLMRSGKLEEQIARIEAQIEHSPGSLGLYQTLLTYCNAAGQRDKVKKLYDKILELRPDDANLRYQLAQQAYRSQDYAGAAEHYKAAILKDAGPFAQNFFMAMQAFRQAKKQGDLSEIVGKLDIRSLVRGNPYNIGNFAEQLMSDPATRDAGIDLFKRAFKALPSQRIQFLANLNDDEFWNLPEVYDHLREVVIPQPAAGTPAPWDILAQYGGYTGDGRNQSIVSRLLDLSARQARLDSLDDEVKSAIDRWPTWSAGKVVRALIRLREGQVEEARAQIQALIDNKDDPLPQTGTIATILGQELEADPATQALAESFYKKSIDDPSGDAWINGYDYSPARRLVDLYKRAGKIDEARALLLSPKILENGRTNYDPNYAAYLKIQSAMQGGQALIQLGFPADAVRLYRAVQLDSSTIQAASQFYGSADQVTMQLRNATDGAIRTLQGDALARAVKTLAGSDADANKGAGRVDHIMLIQPRGFPQGSIVSLLDEALRAAAKDGQSTELAAARAELQAVGREAPDDLSAQAAVAMVAIPAGDRAVADAALQALKAIVEKNPLEPLSKNARANQRQRQEAERWLALWPVVRHCGKDESRADVRELLADRAAEAARRQSDPLWLQVLLRERGQMALDRGDKAAAEKIWGELLDTILANPSGKAKAGPDAAMAAPAGVSVVAVAGTPTTTTRVVAIAPAAVMTKAAVAVPAAPVAAATPVAGATFTAVSGTPATIAFQGGSGGVGTTTDRFTAAAALAKLAAEKGMIALSLRALRDGLRGGPPITPVNVDANQSRTLIIRSVGGFNNDPISQGQMQVEPILAEIDRAWTRAQAPPADVYAALRDIVLPDARPREVFLYTRPLAQAADQPRSAGQMLARWAGLAKQSDDLSKRIDDRLTEPMAELPARILKIQLATASNDRKTSRDGLAWLADRLQKDTLQTTAELACHAALPLLKDPESGEAAANVVDKAIASMFGPSGNPQIGTNLALVMARRHFADGRADKAVALLQQFQSAREKPNGPGVQMNVDQAAYFSKHAQAQVAAEYARAGRLDEAMAQLGQICDAPAISNEPPIRESLAPVAGMLRRLPAGDRYEKLKAWTLPAEGRKLVRMLMTSTRTDTPPPPFPKDDEADPEGLVSTPGLLIHAAAEAGKLDDLAQAAARAQAEGAEHADILVALVELERGDAKPIAAAMADAAAKRKAAQAAADAEDPITVANRGGQLDDNARKTLGRQLPELLLTLAALKVAGKDPALDELATQAAEKQLADQRSGAYQGRLAVALMKARTGDLPTRTPGLRHWRSWSGASRDDSSIGRWMVEGDRLRLVAGQSGSLTFAYPLAGRFALRAEVPADPATRAGLAVNEASLMPTILTMAYNSRGRATQGQAARQYLDLSSLGLQGLQNRGYRADPGAKTIDLALEFEPGKIRYVIDGRTVAEEAAGGAPWVRLIGYQNAEIRRLRIDGAPEIPREVRLVEGDDLGAWVSNIGTGVKRRQRKLLKSAPAEDENSYGYRYIQDEELNGPRFTWQAVDGVILAEPHDPGGTPAFNNPRNQRANRLSFREPLAEGDVLSYEFLHEPGITMVHPTIDRIAFLLEPGGVRLRWLQDQSPDPESAGEASPADRFTVDEPSVRRGDVALKPNDWNSVKITIRGGKAAIELNGTLVAERPTDPNPTPSFGFHLARESDGAKIRNVVLRGDWPEKLPADLLERREPAPPDSDRKLIAWRGEKSIARDAPDVLMAARDLPPADRHDKLAAWVLPTEAHRDVRLAWAILPGESGGTFEAPALDLIGVAKQEKRLDALLERLNAYAPATDEAKRDKAALKALTLVALGRPAEAKDDLSIVASHRPDADPKRPTPISQRDAELIAAAGLVRLGDRAALEAASALFDALAVILKSSPQPDPLRAAREAQLRMRGMLPQDNSTANAGPESLPLHTMRLVAARDRLLRDGVAPAPAPSARWLAGSRETALTRGQGYPSAVWIERDGRISHEPGHAADRLYLATPLRGDFEVTAGLEGLGDDLISISYAGIKLQIDADGTKARLIQPSRSSNPIPIKPAIDPKAGPVPFRMTLKNRVCTFQVGEQTIGQSTVARDVSPWLILEANPRGRGAVRDLKIAGNPENPGEVELAAGPTLEHWYAYFEAMPSSGTAGWEKRGTEIVGERANSVIEPYEDLLRFQRPLADGESIAYEFRYKPSKEMVHPSLDRVAYRIDKDGVRPAPVLGSPVGSAPGGKPAPVLKEDDWNTASLAVKGDRVLLSVNGQEVYEGPIEPSSNRQFGLFHEADSTEARVRNIRLIRP